MVGRLNTTIFRCRTVKPIETPWVDVEWDSAFGAAQEYQFARIEFTRAHRVPTITYRHGFEPGRTELIDFSVVEVEGHGIFVVRTYSRGIWRMGARAKNVPTIQDIARQLNWTRPAEDLLTPWDGEDG